MTRHVRSRHLVPGAVVGALLGLTLLGAPAAEPAERLTSRPRPAPVDGKPATVGDEVRTGPTQRRRLLLPDGTVVLVNRDTTLKVTGERRLYLAAGEVVVTAAAGKGEDATVLVVTPKRELTAAAATFSARAAKDGTDVLVTRGRVKVSGLDAEVRAGEQLAAGADRRAPAPRASHRLDWARELVSAAEAPLVPASRYGGGALVAVDPDGQEARLSLRRYHIDVHVEDGFARTTIDQTYFNHTASRLEGTFYFPLPPDASLSRLAMYVDGKLMEGGMVERDFGRQVYEKIVTSQRDPALLEWVDGSTFKMRVFPLEARQEKRVVLSYAQRLPSLYGQAQYRFPAGHSLDAVGEWSFHARVKEGAGLTWASPSHALKATKEGADLLLDASDKGVKSGRDVVLELTDAAAGNQPAGRFSSFEQDGAKYLMLRYRPALAADDAAPPAGHRTWVFLFESSGDRDPLLARTQVEVIRGLLANAEPDDMFAVLAAGTRARAFADKPLPVTAENVRAALAFLEGSHLIGALDLGGALGACEPLLRAGQNAHLVHVGSGVAAMGERRDDVLAKRVPDGVRYVGVGVGRRWNRNLMKIAAERSGGTFTQINPDEPISWRAFELSATLNTPRLLDVSVSDPAGRVTFLAFSNMAAEGEEVCAVARVGGGSPLPETVAVRGRLNGQAFARDLPVKDVATNVGHLPRTWARLEIERLLAEDAVKHKQAIIGLSKAMYVMTPYTSLLVLENEEMYQQYKVDRGRKDHWALYPCPERIAVVYEPLEGMPPDPKKVGKPSAREVESTVLVRGEAETAAVRRRAHEVIDVLDKSPSGRPASGEELLPAVTAARTGSSMMRESDFSTTLSDMPLPRNLDPASELAKSRKEYLALRREILTKSMAAGAKSMALEAVLPTPHAPPLPTIDGFARPQHDAYGGTGSGPGSVDPKKLASQLNDLMEAPAYRSLVITPFLHDDSDSLVYSRPRFNVPDGLFFDLVAYAPGMDTTRADLLAVLDAEAMPSATSRPGTIDDGARRLFEQARPRGWQTLAFPATADQPAFGITFDGTGRYVFERTLPPGIRERVVCDGTTLLHLYPDLGLGARRSVSRYHRLEFARVIPWFVPTVDDLAPGTDVKRIADRTVAVVPRGSDGQKDADGKAVSFSVVHYVFAEDGRLAERRVVGMPMNKIVYRQIFGADGTITATDGDGKQVAVLKAALRDAREPDLKADTKGLVVLPLPYRDVATTRKRLGIEKKPHAELTFDEARALLAAEFATGRTSGALSVCRESLFARDQKQLGLYVLLAACGVNLDSGDTDVLQEHMHEPLAQYLALHSSPVLRKHASQWAVGSGQWREGYLQHLAVTHALFQRWRNAKALGATEEKRREERDRALDYVRRNKGTAFGWALLCLIKDRADEDEDNKKDVRATHKALAEAWPLFEGAPALAYAAKYEQARSLWKSGQRAEARRRFLDLYERTLKADVLPPIDGDFRAALLGAGQEADPWGELMRRTAAALVAHGQRPAVLWLASQCAQVGDESLPDVLLGAALDGIKDEKERQRMTLGAVSFLMATGQYAGAEGHLRSLLDVPELARQPGLWRLAGRLAERRDQPARQFECLERELDAEYGALPEVINLEDVRQDYARLLNHYQDLANALERLKVPPPPDFVGKVVRTADRWRTLDPEADRACELAGRVLRTVGERELVWDYLTTPVGRRPNESGPWVGLAETLARGGDLALADRAYAAAFEAEPTDAQILWDRAQNLRRSGKSADAQKLYRQLAEGDWQPRFNGVRTQAKWQLERR